MRAYTVATAAVALGVSQKWVDNILSHHRISGVTQSRQGVARRLNIEAVSVLEITLRLTRTFGIPTEPALQIAHDLTASATNLPSVGDADCTLTVDAASVRSHVAARLAEAVEFAPVPRRGRPPRVP